MLKPNNQNGASIKMFLLKCFAGCPVRTARMLRWLTHTGWPILALVLMSVPINLQAQFTYTTNTGTITITGYTGFGGVVAIPGMISGRQVTAIGSWAFYAARVTSVTIPDSVNRISDGAFFDCPSLTNIVVGRGVSNIGNWAFAFSTNLTSICFRGSAPILGGPEVFYSNSATVYYLPDTFRWGSTFGGRPTVLSNISVPFTYISTNDSITITGYTGTDGSPSIPAIIDFLPVTTIGKNTFVYSSITNMTVPYYIRTIEDGAFFGCRSLVGVAIGTGVTNIGLKVFEYCPRLSEITVDALNSTYCSVGGILFSKTQTTLIKCPGAKAGSYTVPISVTKLADEAFQNCSALTDITICDSLTRVSMYAFYGCVSMTNLIIGKNIIEIGDHAFAFCDGLTTVSIPNNVTTIGRGVFGGCTNLADITIGPGVTNIGDYAFSGCERMTSITIPDSVTSLGRNIFIYCPNLGNITLGTNLTQIGESAFENCHSLVSVVIPDRVREIPRSAFCWCYGLTNVVIGNGVTNIEDAAFDECTSLRTLTIPDSVITIGGAAFARCTNLTQLRLGRQVTNIETMAFYNCSGLTEISLPDSVRNIQNEVFAECHGLTNIWLGSGITNIGDHTFSYCTNLANITIPASVTRIGGFAFEFCTSLRGVYFQGNAPSVALWAFAYLWDPVVYYLPGTLGWGPTLGAAQAVLWNPQIQMGDASFGVGTDGLGFNITGTTNIPIVLEACTNLANQQWIPLQSCTLTNASVYFGDPDWTNYPARFYRIRSP